jgi:hypothetical protein
MDYQSQEVQSQTVATTGTLGFQIRHDQNGSHSPKTEATRPQEVLTSGTQESSTDTSTYLTMRIQAATFAIFPARLYTRHLLLHKNQTVHHSTDWDKPVTLPATCLEEIKLWINKLTQWNGRSFLPQTPKEALYVDASDTGWGCSWKTQTAHGYWSKVEAQQSINWRELQAAFLAIKTFHLRNTNLLIRTDNTTSLSYINKQGGTRSVSLMHLAINLWKHCLDHDLIITAKHIPGIENIQANLESRRLCFKNQWQIRPSIFQTIQQLYGFHDVDLFADRTTSLLPKYVSWQPDPDAFTIPWTQFNNPWINPPWNLITKCLHKILNERLPLATIVTPHWPSSLYYPLLQQLAIRPPILLTQHDIQTTHSRTLNPLQRRTPCYPSGRSQREIWHI